MVSVRFLGDHRNRLGESPVWDAHSRRLWWVDAISGEIHGADAAGAARTCWRYDRPVGSIALAASGLVAAMADGFHLIDATTGAATPIAATGSGAGLRLNDGKADRAGRFLAGEMRTGENGRVGRLWRLDRDGTAAALLDGFALANALCFSPDGGTLYVADSLEGVIRAYPYDAGSGAVGERRDLIDCRVHGSLPDGATVDADGNLWVALVLAGAVGCFLPDGALLRRIDLPVPYPSCPAFGGADLTTLFVTTIADSGHRLKSDHPDAGRLVAIDGLGAVGLEEGRYVLDNHMRE